MTGPLVDNLWIYCEKGTSPSPLGCKMYAAGLLGQRFFKENSKWRMKFHSRLTLVSQMRVHLIILSAHTPLVHLPRCTLIAPPPPTFCISIVFNRDLKIRGRRRQRKHRLKSQFPFIQSSSWQFQLSYFVKCWQILSWIPKNRIQFQKEKENFVVACLRPPYNVKLGIFTL